MYLYNKNNNTEKFLELVLELVLEDFAISLCCYPDCAL